MNTPPDDDWFRLDELTERIAGLVWVEERLFEVLGRWSTIEAHHRAKIIFATASRHHGWHAGVLRDCLATSAQLAEASSPHAPTSGWSAAVDSLNALIDPDATVSRLLSLVRVVDPWLARETDTYLDVAEPVSDAHLLRWLRFVQIDHHDDGAEAAQLLDALRTNTANFSDHALVAAFDLS